MLLQQLPKLHGKLLNATDIFGEQSYILISCYSTICWHKQGLPMFGWGKIQAIDERLTLLQQYCFKFMHCTTNTVCQKSEWKAVFCLFLLTAAANSIVLHSFRNWPGCFSPGWLPKQTVYMLQNVKFGKLLGVAFPPLQLLNSGCVLVGGNDQGIQVWENSLMSHLRVNGGGRRALRSHASYIQTVVAVWQTRLTCS